MTQYEINRYVLDTYVIQYDAMAPDRFMPHPDYAAQNFICVFNPGEATSWQVKTFLAEADEIARVRNAKRSKPNNAISQEQ